MGWGGGGVVTGPWTPVFLGHVCVSCLPHPWRAAIPIPENVVVAPPAFGDPAAPRDQGRLFAKCRICQRSLAWCLNRNAAYETLFFFKKKKN